METSTLLSQNCILDRPQLALVPTPAGTATHRPIPHHEVVNAWLRPSASGTSASCPNATPWTGPA